MTLLDTTVPRASSTRAIGSGYTSSIRQAASPAPAPTARNSRPNQLLTRKETARLMSIWARAIRAPTRAVVPPTITSTACTVGLTESSGSSRNSTQAPPSTTTELRSTVEGKGPSIASSSQRCRGIWAHLPIGPAIRASRIKVRAGLGVACSAQALSALMFQLPATGSSATRPASSTRSPTRLVRKASRAPFTTSDWLNQVPTTR